MPDHWQETTLGEVSALEIGRTPSRSNPAYWTASGDRPFCTIADMDGHTIFPGREGVTEAAEADQKARRVKAGSLLMSFKLTIGRVAFAGCDLFPNEAIVAISPDERVVSREFLYVVLGAQDLSAGSGRAVKGKTLNSKSLRAIPLHLPPPPEQRRIVDLIGSIDTYIDRLEGQIDATRVARNGLSFRLLGEVVEDGETASVEDLISIQRGHDLPKKDRIEGEVVVAASSGPVGSHNESKGPVPGVVTGRSGTIGTVMLYPAPYWPLNTSLYVTDFKGSDPFFVAEVLRWMRLERFAGGGAVPSLDRKVLYRELVPKPSIDRQREIASLLRSIDEQVSSLESQVESARALRSGVLTQLLSGERLLDDSYDTAVGL